MKDLIDNVLNYTDSILGIPFTIKDSPNINLPLMLRNNYRIHTALCLGESILLVSLKEDFNSPSILKKHLIQLEKKTGLLPVYISSGITPYTRKELIKNRISFIVPDGQMFYT